MSPGRDRAVSVATVLLALAGGVVLGGGPLQGDEDSGTSHPAATGASSTPTAELQTLQRARAYDDAYVRATAPRVIGHGLHGRSVTVVTLPGADPDRVAELSELVTTASGAVTTRAAVDPTLLDVGNRQLVAELARQTQDAARPPVDVPRGTEGYDLAGRLLGHALLTHQDAGAPLDRTGDSVLAGFTTAGLLTTDEPVTRRGSLVLLVAGPPTGTPDQRQGAAAIVASLARGLDASGDGAVLAGPSASGAADGVIGALRATRGRRDTSTVDALESLAGGVAAVRALADQARGRTGDYGSDAAPDGLLPQGAAGR